MIRSRPLGTAGLAVAALAGSVGMARADAAAPAPTMVDTPIGPRPLRPLPPYHPGTPDPAAVAAGEDANVEPPHARRGLALVAQLGPAILIGINKEHATGTGGGFSFRVGAAAGRDTVVTLELTGVVFPYTFEVAGPPVERHRAYNQSAALTLGGQVWVAPTFWVRGAAGLAVFTSRVEGVMRDATETRVGGALVSGAGVEVVRRHALALAIEAQVQGALYRDGAVFGGILGLSLGLY